MGLPNTDEVKDVVVDPTTQEYMPGAIVRHSVPKESTIEEPNFEVFLSCRSGACRMIMEATSDQKNSCQPCVTAFNAVNTAVRRKSKASAEPAKSKASLAACEAEKLRATVQVTRLKCKQLHPCPCLSSMRNVYGHEAHSFLLFYLGRHLLSNYANILESSFGVRTITKSLVCGSC